VVRVDQLLIFAHETECLGRCWISVALAEPAPHCRMKQAEYCHIFVHLSHSRGKLGAAPQRSTIGRARGRAVVYVAYVQS